MKVWVLASTNIFGGLIFGYNTGVIAGALEGISQTFGFANAPNVKVIQGIVTGSILLGAMFGSVGGGKMTDLIGRRPSMIVLSLICIIGAIASAAAAGSVYVLCAFRLIIGLSVGWTSVACPMYVSETAPPHRVGSLGTLFQLSLTFGILLGYLMNFALGNNWRVMFGLGGIPGLILLILAVFFVAESPKWLDRKQERTPEDEGQFKMLFTREAVKPLLQGLLLSVVLQLTGINAVMYFAPEIFQKSGYSNTQIPTIILGAWNFITTLIAVFFVDRSGRRPLLIGGVAVMAVACIILGFATQFIGQPAQRYVSLTMVALYVAGFEGSIGPLFFVLCTELFPPHIKDSGAGVANAMQWLFNLLLSSAFLTILNAVGQAAVFWGFGGLAVVTNILVFFFIPETKRKSDDERSLLHNH